MESSNRIFGHSSSFIDGSQLSMSMVDIHTMSLVNKECYSFAIHLVKSNDLSLFKQLINLFKDLYPGENIYSKFRLSDYEFCVFKNLVILKEQFLENKQNFINNLKDLETSKLVDLIQTAETEFLKNTLRIALVYQRMDKSAESVKKGNIKLIYLYDDHVCYDLVRYGHAEVAFKIVDIMNETQRNKELCNFSLGLTNEKNNGFIGDNTEKKIEMANKISNPRLKSQTFEHIYGILLESNGSTENIERAIALCTNMPDVEIQSYNFLKICSLLIKNEHLIWALIVAEKIQDPIKQSVAFRKITMSYRENGNIDMALNTAERIEEQSMKSSELADIAHSLAKDQKINRALEVASTIPTEAIKKQVLGLIENCSLISS